MADPWFALHFTESLAHCRAEEPIPRHIIKDEFNHEYVSL
jgi:hypothetical protein